MYTMHTCIRLVMFTALASLLATTGDSAQQANAPAPHTLKATPNTVAWGYYDAKATPEVPVKPGDTMEIQTPVAPQTAQEEKQPIIYVKHLESPVRYPPLARQTRLTGAISIKLTIAADGSVLKMESSVGDKSTVGFGLLKDDAERIVKSWRFGCVGCPPNLSFEQTIKFIYKVETEMSAPSLRVVMNLPDEVTMSTDAVTIQPSNNSKKGSQ